MKLSIKPMTIKEHILFFSVGVAMWVHGSMSIISIIGIQDTQLNIFESLVFIALGFLFGLYHLKKTVNYPGFKNL